MNYFINQMMIDTFEPRDLGYPFNLSEDLQKALFLLNEMSNLYFELETWGRSGGGHGSWVECVNPECRELVYMNLTDKYGICPKCGRAVQKVNIKC